MEFRSSKHLFKPTAVIAALFLLGACATAEGEGEDETVAGAPESSTEAEDPPVEEDDADTGAEDPGTDADADAHWDLDELRVVMSAGPGGAVDTLITQLQPAFEQALGASIRVEHHQGAAGALAISVMMEEGDDCSVVQMTSLPHSLFTIENEMPEVEADEYIPIGRIAGEPAVIRVQNDAPWETLQDLVDAAADDPGNISVSVAGVLGNQTIAVRSIEDATGVDFNIVPFDGGNDARTALLGGHVDVASAGVYNSVGIADETRVLAVLVPENEWPDLTDDAPTASDALGTGVPDSWSTNALYASQACVENEPGRYQALVEALAEAMEDPDYLAQIEELGEEGRIGYMPPDELAAHEAEEREMVLDLIARQGDL
jgi:putative tricarboxylic transport membrane protein